MSDSGGTSDVVHEVLVGTLAAVGAVVAGSPGAIAGGALAPVLVAGLTQRGVTRIEVVHSFARDEVERRDALGERPRADLEQADVQELLEGSIVKARDSYESHKCKHFAFFLVKVLYDDQQDLGEAFFQLGIAEKLTYHQYLLLRFFEIATTDPGRFELSSDAFGHDPPPDVAQLMLPLLDLFQLGLLTEEEGLVLPAVGGLASRYDSTNISGSQPAKIRLSLLGSKLATNLGLHLVPDDLLQGIQWRLRPRG